MKIGIFGAHGYIGRSILENLNHHEFVSINIREKIDFDLIQGIEAFINCIGKTPDSGKYSYNEYYEANVDSLKKIIEIFNTTNAKMLIHFSSISAVEELSLEEILTEDTICNPITDYGKTKRAAEELLLDQKSHEKTIVIIRPTRIHGVNDKGTIFQLYNLVNKIPYPFGNYDNKRSFLALDNLLFMLDKILNSKEIEYGIYNVCDDEPVSTNDIIKTFQKIDGKKRIILKIPKFIFNIFAKIGDTLRLPFNSITLTKVTTSRIVSNQKIKTALGIEKLPISAKEGLEITIKSFR